MLLEQCGCGVAIVNRIRMHSIVFQIIGRILNQLMKMP